MENLFRIKLKLLKLLLLQERFFVNFRCSKLDLYPNWAHISGNLLSFRSCPGQEECQYQKYSSILIPSPVSKRQLINLYYLDLLMALLECLIQEKYKLMSQCAQRDSFNLKGRVNKKRKQLQLHLLIRLMLLLQDQIKGKSEFIPQNASKDKGIAKMMRL